MPKEERSLTTQTVEGSFWNVAISIIQRVCGLIFTIIIARALLPEGFGLFNLVLSIAFLFTLFTEGGINNATVFCFSAKTTKKNAQTYFQYILKLKIIFLILSSTLLILFAYPAANYLFKKPIFMPLILSSIYILIFSFSNFFTYFFFAQRKVKYAFYKEAIYQVARITGILLLFFILPYLTVSYILIILGFAAFVSSLYVFSRAYVSSSELFKKDNSIKEKDKKRILKFTTYLTLTSLAYLLFGNIDNIMLGVFVNNAAVIGIYRSAFVLSSSIGGIFIFYNVLLPVFIQVKKIKLEDAFNKVFRLSSIMVIPTALGLAALGNYFLVLIYGYEYLNAALPLIFLSLTIIPGTIAFLLMTLFFVKEKPKDYIYLLLLGVVLNIFLNYSLIKLFSRYSELLAATGVAISGLVTWLIFCVALIILANKKLKIKLKINAMVAPIICSVLMISSIFLLKFCFGDISLLSGILLVFIGAVIYFVTMFLIRGITKEDLSLVKILLKRK